LRYIILFFLVLIAENSNDFIIKPTTISRIDRYDFYPKKFDEGILFSSYNKDDLSALWTGRSKIYFSKIFDNDFLSDPIEVVIEGDSSLHYAAAEYVPISDELYFNRNNNSSTTSTKEINNLGIYKGYFENNRVADIKKLKFCSPKYSYYHPTISDDGLSMIFSSNLDGEIKLYETKREFIGEEWNKIKLIEEIVGKNIWFPNLLNDSTLTYSREIENTKLDIFIANKINGVWKESKNWVELNSVHDDFGVELIDSLNGYFSSNRNDNVDNIFYFKVEN